MNTPSQTPMTLDALDRRGSDAAHGLRSAHPTPPSFDPGRRQPPSGLAVGVVIAMIALAVGAASLAVLPNWSDNGSVAEGLFGPAGSDAPLVPDYLPDGFELVTIDVGGGQGMPEARIIEQVYGMTGDDPHDGPIMTFARWEHDEPVSFGGLEGDTPDDSFIDIDGRLVMATTRSQSTGFRWYEDNTRYDLGGRWVDESLLADAARQFFAGAEMVPPGWELIHESEYTTNDLYGPNVYYSNAETDESLHIRWSRLPVSIDLLRARALPTRDCPERQISACGVSVTTVRDLPALQWGRSSQRFGFATIPGIAWVESHGRMVGVSGSVSAEEMMLVAESLRPGTWQELRSQLPPDVDPEDEVTVPSTDVGSDQYGDPPGASPGQSTEAARGLIGDPSLQFRPVLAMEGDPTFANPDPFSGPLPAEETARLGGPIIDGYGGVYDLGPSALDGDGLVDAYAIPGASNAVSMVRDQVWLRLDAAGTARLNDLASQCHERDSGCPTGAIAVVWGAEVISVVTVMRGAGGFQPFESEIAIPIESWRGYSVVR